MRRILRRIGLLVAALLVAALVALTLFARGLVGGDAVRRALEEQLTAALGHPVRIGSLSASFVPRITLDLRDLTIGDPVRATIDTIAFGTGLRALFAKRIEDAAIVIAGGRIPADLAAGLAGALAGGTPSGGTKGFTIITVRTLAFRRLQVVAGQRTLLLDLESALEGDRVEVTRLAAASEGTQLQGRGTLTSLARHAGTFSVTADRLNLDELLATVLALSKGQGNRGRTDPVPLDVTIGVSAPVGQFGGYEFRHLESTLRLAPAKLAAAPLRFRFFSGHYDGAIHMTSSGAVPRVSLNGSIRGIDLSSLLAAVSGSASVTGTLGGTLSLNGSGSTADDVLKSATGSGRIAVTDGVIPGLELVREIVLAFGKPSGDVPAGSGSAFSRLGGTFALGRQLLRSNDFTLESRDFDLAGTVTVSVPSGAVDLRGNVVLSRELTAQAGSDLRRYAQEDGRVVVPVTITGTVAAPRVMVDVAGAVSRALQNELKRRVKGLFDRIIKK